MAEAQSLTLAFMRAHPSQAARVLESMSAADAAALFRRAPVRLATSVLTSMLPTAAARSLGELDDERAMELLGSVGMQPAVALLRHIAEPRRSRLVSGLPTAIALASRALLGYPEDSVGAWTDPDVIALTADTSARDALDRVRGTRAFADEIFVVESEQRLAGRVTLAQLLRAADATPLGTLATKPDSVLAVHAPLASALAHPGWSVHAALPVLQQGSRLIGVLTQRTLMQAYERHNAASPDESGESLAGVMARGYWEAFSGILHAAVTLLPTVGAVNGLHGGAHGKH